MIILEKELEKLIKIPNDIQNLTISKITDLQSFLSTEFQKLENVVVGFVKECVDHPDSDHLHITKVDVGLEELQIICGAKNIRQGQYVIVAKIGAVLPGNFKIDKAKLRGVESFGMICSLKELGLENLVKGFEDGIFYFDKPVKPGTSYYEALNLEGFKIELDLTPNRNDLLSYFGYANDLLACQNKKQLEVKEYDIKYTNYKNDLKINIETENCNQITFQKILNIKNNHSPLWLKVFLKRHNIQSQNLIVDLTNYIMLFYGIPLHAYDLDKIKSNEITVKSAIKGEKVKALNNLEYTLNGSETIIYDDKTPISIAGIIGLDNSKVSDDTENVLIEIGSFNANNICFNSRYHNLNTDASIRFQKGSFDMLINCSLNKLNYLINKETNCKITKPKTLIKNKFKLKQINFNLVNLNNLLGTNLQTKEVSKILINLGFDLILDQNSNITKLIAPKYRTDILIEADVIEEVARIIGYDNLKGKKANEVNNFFNSKKLNFLKYIKNNLKNQGFYETLTHSLTSPDKLLKYDNSLNLLKLNNILSNDKQVYRSFIFPSLIDIYLYNKNNKNQNLNFFEISKVYRNNKETLNLAVLLSSNLNYNSILDKEKNELSFFTLKAVFNNLFHNFNFDFKLVKSTNQKFHPNYQADILLNNQKVGFIFKHFPENNLENIFIFEIFLDQIFESLNFNINEFKEYSKFPSVHRDIAFLIDKKVDYLQIVNEIKNSYNLISEVELFDIYEDQNLDLKNVRSLAFHITISANKTFELNEINQIIDKVINNLISKFNIEVRK